MIVILKYKLYSRNIVIIANANRFLVHNKLTLTEENMTIIKIEIR